MIDASLIAGGIMLELSNVTSFPGQEMVLNEPLNWVSIARCSELCNATVSHHLGWFWFYIVILAIVIVFLFVLLFKINSRLKKLQDKEAMLGIKHEPIIDIKKILEGMEEGEKK